MLLSINVYLLTLQCQRLCIISMRTIKCEYNYDCVWNSLTSISVFFLYFTPHIHLEWVESCDKLLLCGMFNI